MVHEHSSFAAKSRKPQMLAVLWVFRIIVNECEGNLRKHLLYLQ